jgi:alpha-L-fucosidase
VDNVTVPYNYTVAQSSVPQIDVIKSFAASAQKYGVGHGLYYSTVVNNYLNVQASEVNPNGTSPGQVGVTNATFDQIVVDQLTEIWSNYGSFTEVSLTEYTLSQA